MNSTEASSMGPGPMVTEVDDRRYLGLESELRAGSDTLLLKPNAEEVRLGRLQLTPFGMLAPSLAQHLGILAPLADEIVPQLVPRCPECGQLAQPPGDLRSISLPSEGFLAVALVDDRQDVPLRERCELLGTERAVVGDSVVRVDEAPESDGEPVLALVSASHQDEFRSTISLWLRRGSATLRLLHLTERGAPARELARLHSVWSCVSCSTSFRPASKGELAPAPECVRCKGEGWLEVDRGRLTSCEACDGFGLSSDFARYEWHGIKLSHLAGLAFNFVRARLSPDSSVAAALDCALRHGFGEYPLGAPLGTCSAGERARLSSLCIELSRIEGYSIGSDGAALFPSGTEPGALGMQLFVPRVVEIHPRPWRAASERFAVRFVERGPLHEAEISFPIGGLSVIQGESGSGKSLLLEEIAFLFSRRRKLAQRCSFPGLSRCTIVDPLAPLPSLVGDLVGITPIMAEELAGTRVARERGVEARDISLATSRFRCSSCAEKTEEQGCAECGGTEIDFVAGDIPFGKMRWSEVLHAPLAVAAGLLWKSDQVGAIAAALPKAFAERLTLASRTAGLSGPEQRTLQVLGALAAVASAKRGTRLAPLDGELLLLNAPFSLSCECQGAVWKLICELNDRGATILCAGVPQALESGFGSVLRLRPCGEVAAERVGHRMYDVRHSRAVRAEVVKR